jgi:hypothetical protein
MMMGKEVIVVSPETMQALLKLIENPPSPSPVLIEEYQNYLLRRRGGNEIVPEGDDDDPHSNR